MSSSSQNHGLQHTRLLCSSLSLCCANHFHCVRLFVTLWTIAHQSPLSMGFSRQEYWSGLQCPSPEDLPDPGIESAFLMTPALAEDSLPLAPSGKASSSATLFSCLQSFPESGPSLMSQLSTSGSQSIGASTSASVLPKNVQGWFPLG